MLLKTSFIDTLFDLSVKRDWSKEIRTRARVTNSRALTPVNLLKYRSLLAPW